MSENPPLEPGDQFRLPAQIESRETADGWQRWRLNRHEFIPAPLIDKAAYRRLTPRRRSIYDLHRETTHCNMPLLETPMSAAVARVMRLRIRQGALKHGPATRPGLMIDGGGYQGKTETACEVAAAFEDAWLALNHQLNPDAIEGTRDLHTPVVYVQTPVTAKPKSTCKAVLDFFGASHKYLDLPGLVRQVRASLHDHGVRALILDDITRLRMHRADDQDTLDLIRAFMSMNVTLVLIGIDIPGSGLLGPARRDPRTGQWVYAGPSPSAAWADHAATQTQRRFDLIHLDRFRYDTAQEANAWCAHLTGIEAHLRLLSAIPGMLTDGTMPEYLFRRTDGVVGLLERLIEDGCALAMETGTEKLTTKLLDNVEIDLGHSNARRDAEEIPPVPPRASRRPRNGSFDDKGPTDSAGRAA